MTAISALVVLHPAGGTLRGDDIITADDYERFLPAPEDVQVAMDWFRAAGFTVEAPGPNSFSIGADAELFRRWFDSGTGPFDLSALPSPVRDTVADVAVSEPPDFGPGNP